MHHRYGILEMLLNSHRGPQLIDPSDRSGFHAGVYTFAGFTHLFTLLVAVVNLNFRTFCETAIRRPIFFSVEFHLHYCFAAASKGKQVRLIDACPRLTDRDYWIDEAWLPPSWAEMMMIIIIIGSEQFLNPNRKLRRRSTSPLLQKLHFRGGKFALSPLCQCQKHVHFSLHFSVSPYFNAGTRPC